MEDTLLLEPVIKDSPGKDRLESSRDLQTHFLGEHQTIEKRMAAGKELRKKSPLIRLGTYKTSAKREDPVSILEKQAITRLPELVPIRYARMLASPFAFLRGSAAVMAADLASGFHPVGIDTQICGDMHVSNFGLFASAERNLVFGINDFDETIRGPFEWDLKRLVASIVAAGRFLGASSGQCEESVVAAVRTYRKKMHEYAHFGNLELWYEMIGEKDILKAFSSEAAKQALKTMEKARGHTHMQVLGKLADMVDDKYRLKVNAPFIVRETHDKLGRPIAQTMGEFFESYFKTIGDERKNLLKQYRVTDVVRKIVGVGSVGTRCWVVFLMGNHDQDPLFLQIKQAEASVYEPYVHKSIYTNQGHRVVMGQRIIQAAPDIFLGWFEAGGGHFYVRQLRDMKGGVEIDPATTKIELMDEYSALCGWALALAHAKGGDAALMAGYAGGKSEELDEAMVHFAFAYADQTEKDFAALSIAAKKGRIQVAGSAE